MTRLYLAFVLVVALLLLAAWLTQPASEPIRLTPTPQPAPTTVLVGEPV